MKRFLSMAVLAALVIVSTLALARSASAEEAKMVGIISKIEMASDQKSAIVALKDSNSGETAMITITDDLTLDKFRDNRIVEGDEIRCKYEKAGDRNTSRMFKKTAGC